MIETLMHLVGLCPDHHAHLNLLQLLAGGLLTSCSAAGCYVCGFFRRRAK